MRESKKKPILLILAALLALVLSALASIFAVQSIYAGVPAIYDEADILTEEKEAELSQEVSEAVAETGWNILILTTDDTGGKSAEQYLEDTYDETFGPKTDGIGFIIDMEHRQYRVTISGLDSAYDALAHHIDAILDAGEYDIREGDYADGFSAMLRKSVKYLRDLTPHLEPHDFVVGGIIGAIVFFVIVGVTAGRYHLKWGTYSYDYHKEGKVQITNRKDQFVNQVVTHHRIESESSRGGGSLNTHSSSGGGIHTGGGRSF